MSSKNGDVGVVLHRVSLQGTLAVTTTRTPRMSIPASDLQSHAETKSCTCAVCIVIRELVLTQFHLSDFCTTSVLMYVGVY